MIDLPGSYSIYPTSEDENVFIKYLKDNGERYAGVVYILDALSVRRGLLLLNQIQDLGIPTLLVINQMDEAEKRGVHIDTAALQQHLGVDVITISAKEKQGIDALKQAIFENQFKTSETPFFEIPSEQKSLLAESNYEAWASLLLGETKAQGIVPRRLQPQETIRRYQSIDALVTKVVVQKAQFKQLLTEQLDKILVHPVWRIYCFWRFDALDVQLYFFLGRISYGVDRNGFLGRWLKILQA
ncbi:hypothetical protein BPO_1357 [Bergeyella porcorum]|uniref:FeoB-type G domain-containing protein n=1 Tax=Bergeyella porcorum TaxID=1735111 RepID=A0AAU0F3F6_9FLAO